MKFDYDEILDLADELIRDFGMEGTIRKLVDGGSDPINPVPVSAAFPVRLVVLDYSNEKPGTLIEAGDKMILVSPKDLSITVSIGDSVKANSLWYDIKNVKITAPAGMTVLYELQARR